MLFGAIITGVAWYFGAKFYQKKSNNKPKKSALNAITDDTSPKTRMLRVKEQNDAKEVHQYFVLSIGMLGLMLGSVVGYPIFGLMSVVGVTYLSMPFILHGYQELFQEHQIGARTLDAVVAVSLLALKSFFVLVLFFVFFYTSKKLLIKTQDQSKQGLINLFTEVPREVWVLKEGVKLQTLFEQLQVGDTIVIHAGELIPIDGTIMEGIGNIDQHKLTGEAQLADKTVGDPVFASTLLMSGKIHIRVDKTGKETVAAKIGEILNNTTDYKLSLQTRGERITDKSALPTLTIGAITLPILGPASAVAILFASFGYNMRIIAPLSVLNYLKMTSKQGILVKDGRALEELRNIDTVVFDKTGTLTQEQPTIATIYNCSTYTQDEILCYAAIAEQRQTHPIARAILQEAQSRHLTLLPVDDAAYQMGYGLKVWVEDDKLIRVGSAKFMELEKIVIPTDIDHIQARCNERGTSLVYVAIGEQLGGVIELRATIRPNTKKVISKLHRRGMTIVIISGDHKEPTRQLARELNIERYFAETLPEKKADIIKQLQKEGKSVCYVGDGINDSIALKTANVSISLRGASTIAADTAQIILMDQHLNHLPYLFDQALNLDHNMKNNLILTIIPGFICIGGVYFLHFGLLTVTLLYNASLAVGVANAMWPMIEHK